MTLHYHPIFGPAGTPPKGQCVVLNFASSKKGCTMYTLTQRSSLICIFSADWEARLNRLPSEKCPNSGHQLPQRAWEETQDPFSLPQVCPRGNSLLPIRNMHNSIFLPPPSPGLRNEQFWSLSQQNHLHTGSMEIFLLWLKYFQTFPLYSSLRMKIKWSGRGNKRGMRGKGRSW